MVRIHGRKYADIEAVAIFDAGTRESRIWPAFFPKPVAVRSTLSSECLGQFWRAEVGQFWKAPKPWLAGILRAVLSLGVISVHASTGPLAGPLGESEIQKAAWSFTAGDTLDCAHFAS